MLSSKYRRKLNFLIRVVLYSLPIFSWFISMFLLFFNFGIDSTNFNSITDFLNSFALSDLTNFTRRFIQALNDNFYYGTSLNSIVNTMAGYFGNNNIIRLLFNYSIYLTLVEIALLVKEVLCFLIYIAYYFMEKFVHAGNKGDY